MKSCRRVEKSRSPKIAVFICLIAGILISPVAWSQDCNALISHGLRNIEIQKSTAAAIATKYYRNCGLKLADLSDQVLGGLEVEVFGYGSGNASFSRAQREQRLEQWCVTNSEYAQSAQEKYFESQSIMAEALVAWNHCNQLASRGVHTEPRISGDQQVVELAVSNTGPGPVDFYGVALTNFTCDIKVPGMTADQVKKTLGVGKSVALGPAAINIHCERKSEQKQIEGQQYSWMSAATISVRTASDPYQLFFPEASDPVLPEKIAKRIESDLLSTRRILTPVGAIMGFVLNPQEVLELAPFWLPADGRTVADPLSPINGRKLPNMAGRGLRGLDPGKDASDDASTTGGTLRVDAPFYVGGTTSEMVLSRCSPGFQDEGRNHIPGSRASAVWDTPGPEESCQHTHQLGKDESSRATLRGDLPPAPYREVIFLVRVR